MKVRDLIQRLTGCLPGEEFEQMRTIDGPKLRCASGDLNLDGDVPEDAAFLRLGRHLYAIDFAGDVLVDAFQMTEEYRGRHAGLDGLEDS
jgi:hypothetical protein